MIIIENILSMQAEKSSLSFSFSLSLSLSIYIYVCVCVWRNARGVVTKVLHLAS